MILDTNALSRSRMACLQLFNISRLRRSFTFRSSCWENSLWHRGLPSPARIRRMADAWAGVWNVLPVVEETATHYASIRQQLKKAGTPLPSNDVWIAALAQQHDLAILAVTLTSTRFPLYQAVMVIESGSPRSRSDNESSFSSPGFRCKNKSARSTRDGKKIDCPGACSHKWQRDRRSQKTRHQPPHSSSKDQRNECRERGCGRNR